MKVYLRTTAEVATLASAYVQVFNGRVLKHAYQNPADKLAATTRAWQTSYDYAYFETETNDRIMIARYREGMPPRGFSLDVIFTYDDPVKFKATYERLVKHPSFKMDYDITNYGFNTLTKFYDEWGYGWVLELNTAPK